MPQLTVGQVKTHFSEVLQKVQQGKSVSITYGKNKKKVAALIPYNQLPQKTFILGILEGKASFMLHNDFEMTDDELLHS